MSGVKRLEVGKITQGKARGKALSDELYNALCHPKIEEIAPKKKNNAKNK